MKALFLTLITTIAVNVHANEENIEYYHPEKPKHDLVKRPAIPKLTTPAPLSTVDGDEIKFQWAPVENATAYALQISSDSNFYDLIVNEPLYKETSYTLKGHSLVKDKNYYWSVAAVKEDNQPGSIKSLPNRSSFHTK